jgi:hypothetical protein
MRDPFHVAGIVSDDDGNPLSGATVTILSKPLLAHCRGFGHRQEQR